MNSIKRFISGYFGLILALFLVSGCNGDTSYYDDYTAEGEEEIPVQEIIQTGVASWYGPGFDGRLTSSRDRFDQNALTAAHRTLPFNTVVEVVNTENDKTVEVRINDRGPYHRNRIIDLSKAAAEEIGMLDSGTAEVELILVEAGGPLPEDLNRPTFTIQLGEYNRVRYAERFAESIGDGVRIEQRFTRGDRIAYMIFYGTYNSMSAAREDLVRLEERGFEGLIRQID
jgi:rare lipoprotein A